MPMPKWVSCLEFSLSDQVLSAVSDGSGVDMRLSAKLFRLCASCSFPSRCCVRLSSPRCSAIAKLVAFYFQTPATLWYVVVPADEYDFYNMPIICSHAPSKWCASDKWEAMGSMIYRIGRTHCLSASEKWSNRKASTIFEGPSSERGRRERVRETRTRTSGKSVRRFTQTFYLRIDRHATRPIVLMRRARSSKEIGMFDTAFLLGCSERRIGTLSSDIQMFHNT